jgi:predicted RNA polymerase sigma factor
MLPTSVYGSDPDPRHDTPGWSHHWQPALAAYAQLPAVRGELLARLDRLDEARQEFERAAALTSNQRERALFRARAAACAAPAKEAS